MTAFYLICKKIISQDPIILEERRKDLLFKKKEKNSVQVDVMTTFLHICS
jgi:hypothetical protein